MKFVIASVQHWAEMGLDTTHCRKSDDGLKALVHYELAKVINPAIDNDAYVSIYEHDSPTFLETMATAWLNKPLTLNEMVAQKVEKMRQVCEYRIINEFYSSCLGVNKRFDCEITDQINIQGLVAKAQLMIVNPTVTDNILEWKGSGEPICYPWRPEQIIQLGIDLYAHVSGTIKRYEELKQYIVNPMRTMEELKVVTWDFDIPVE